MDEKLMDVTAVLKSGKQIPFRVKASDTVRQVKAQIEIMSEIPKPFQRLEYRGDDQVVPLLDHVTIGSQIPNGAFVHFFERETLKMSLNVKSLEPKTYEIQADTYDTIGDIVHRINSHSDIPVDTCSELIYEGRQLLNDWTLEDCNMPSGALVYLVMTLKDISKNRDSGNYTIIQPSNRIDSEYRRVENGEHGTFALVQPNGPFDRGYGRDYEYIYIPGWPRSTYMWPYHANFVPEQPPPKDGVIEVNIILPDNRFIVMSVKPHHKIIALKHTISVAERVPKHQQILKYNGVTMNDNYTIAGYNIRHGDTIHLTWWPEKSSVLRVRIGGAPMTFRVERGDKISALKDLIAVKTGKRAHDFDLARYNDGVLLDEDKTLWDYGIEEHDRLDLVGMNKAPLSSRRPSLVDVAVGTTPLDLRLLEIRGPDQVFSIQYPDSVVNLKAIISERTEIDEKELIVTVLEDGSKHLDDADLKKLRSNKHPLVFYRLKSEEPDHSFNCSIL